jgi:hypothetical protein
MTKKQSKKLRLSRETLRSLGSERLAAVNGMAWFSWWPGCFTNTVPFVLSVDSSCTDC